MAMVWVTCLRLSRFTNSAGAAGGSTDIKTDVYLTNLTDFPVFNETMTRYFTEPYPARTTIQVSALPKASQIEIDAIMVL